jgi:hypothetical protein
VASGRHWPLPRATYEALAAESEYAAWVAAFGFRANHFTIDVESLSTFPNLASVCGFLAAEGFALNQAGGLVKGSAAQGLEQASTLADEAEVEVEDGGRIRIPSCYVELARRHAGPDGRRFEGFIAGSADKIFESTDRR